MTGLFAKIGGARRRVAAARARTATERDFPELLRAYAAFAAASQISSSRQPFKGWDVWQLLERFRPRHIAEMGSGTTSAVFALWAQRNGAQYVCFEHHPQWAELTQRCLNESGICAGRPTPVRVVASRVREDGAATGFVEPIPAQADFIYIDGPPCLLPNGRKVPNDDIERLFSSGVRPLAIVLDGRLETVDLIRNHPVGRYYDCELGYAYGLKRGRLGPTVGGREHTVFVLKHSVA